MHLTALILDAPVVTTHVSRSVLKEAVLKGAVSLKRSA